MMTTHGRSPWTLLLPLLPVLCGLALLAADPVPLQALRHGLFDQFQRWQPREYRPVPVRIVDVDDASLARLGQWPWPRSRIAELVDRLRAAGAAAIAFDVMFAEPDRTSPAAAAALWRLAGPLRDGVLALPDHDRILADSLARADSVVGFALEPKDSPGQAPPAAKARFVQLGAPQGRWLHGFAGAVATLPALEAAARGNGALSFVPDSDGILRRVPLVLRLGETPVATLASEALRVAQGTENIILRSAGADAGLAEIRIGDLAVPVTPQGEIWLHYTGPVAERHVPAWKLLADDAAAASFAGQIVLVGSSAQGLMDLRFSPFGLMPGVEAHAQALEQMLAGQHLQRPAWARGLEALVLLVAGVACGLLALRTRALLAAAVCLALLAGLFAGAWYAFARQGLLLDAALPGLVVAGAFAAASLWHHLATEKEQRWIRAAFARYVSPNRVAHLMAHPADIELGGRRQQCSFVFTDLESFTGLMEGLDPGKAVGLLNTYLDGMIAIAFRHEGTLDRIVGDAVAIMFSAPVPQADHRRRALACALEMDAFASRYARDLQARGIPFGRTRIGVHAGEVIVGNFGGSTMFDYRALGDAVNTASRLEAVNKHLGTRLCLSEAILEDCPEARVRPVGRLRLKGKTAALAVFEPVSGEQAPLADYLEAYQALREQRPEAAAAFARLAAAHPDDPLVALHQRRLAAGEQGDLMVMSEK